MMIEELGDKEKMQKKLYEVMVNAIEDDLNSKSIQNQVTTVQEIYTNNIEELKCKHEAHLKEIVEKSNAKCDQLYAYIKEAEKLLDEMDVKRKRDK